MDMMNLLKISTLFGNFYETKQDCMGCRQRQSRSKLCIIPIRVHKIDSIQYGLD